MQEGAISKGLILKLAEQIKRQPKGNQSQLSDEDYAKKLQELKDQEDQDLDKEARVQPINLKKVETKA
jgi:hypothetical protein